MGIIIKTDLFSECLDEDFEKEKIQEEFDKRLLKKYSILDIFIALLIFAIGVVFNFLLTSVK